MELAQAAAQLTKGGTYAVNDNNVFHNGILLFCFISIIIQHKNTTLGIFCQFKKTCDSEL